MLAGNPNLDQVVFSLRWILSSKTNEKKRSYNQVKLWLIQSFCSWQFINASKILFILLAGNPYFDHIVFVGVLLDYWKSDKITWILLSSRVTADTIVLLMSQLLMLASFICFFSLESTLESSRFPEECCSNIIEKKQKKYAIIKLDYDRYNRFVYGSCNVGKILYFC